MGTLINLLTFDKKQVVTGVLVSVVDSSRCVVRMGRKEAVVKSMIGTKLQVQQKLVMVDADGELTIIAKGDASTVTRKQIMVRG